MPRRTRGVGPPRAIQRHIVLSATPHATAASRTSRRLNGADLCAAASRSTMLHRSSACDAAVISPISLAFPSRFVLTQPQVRRRAQAARVVVTQCEPQSADENLARRQASHGYARDRHGSHPTESRRSLDRDAADADARAPHQLPRARRPDATPRRHRKRAQPQPPRQPRRRPRASKPPRTRATRERLSVCRWTTSRNTGWPSSADGSTSAR